MAKIGQLSLDVLIIRLNLIGYVDHLWFLDQDKDMPLIFFRNINPFLYGCQIKLQKLNLEKQLVGNWVVFTVLIHFENITFILLAAGRKYSWKVEKVIFYAKILKPIKRKAKQKPKSEFNQL